MVVFSCNNCGDTLQKPRVAKHYQFQCRKRVSLSCVDCFKDFLDDEYVAHTKCITEAERYGGKNFVAKASANKGEKKQQEWIRIINDVLTLSSLSKDETSFLKSISKHENVPRKKAKFLNFVKNAMGYRVNMNVVESCWSKIETAFKENVNANKEAKQPDDSVKEDVTNGDCKKRRLEDDGEECEAKKCKVEEKLVWQEKIVEVLADREEISLKKLKKKLLNKYFCSYKDNVDKFDRKLLRKLGKMKEFKLEDDKIKRV